MNRVAIVLSVFFIACAPVTRPAESSDREAPSLIVRELVVVDRHGTPRIRLAGEVPDAVIEGRRVPRGERAAGIILYDSTGQERSGYVTFEPSGNVGLTLDTQRGQVALFVAGRDGGAALQMWRGRDVIELRSDSDGSRLTAVRNGELVFQEPSVASMRGETCAAYKGALSRVSREQVNSDCRRRFNDQACRACLDE